MLDNALTIADLKEKARRRLAFDELLRVQLVLVMRKRAMERDAVGIRHAVGGALVERFLAALHFPLTTAQRRVIAAPRVGGRAAARPASRRARPAGLRPGWATPPPG